MPARESVAGAPKAGAVVLIVFGLFVTAGCQAESRIRRTSISPLGDVEAALVSEGVLWTTAITIRLRQRTDDRYYGEVVFRVHRPFGLNFQWTAADRLLIRHSGGEVRTLVPEWNYGGGTVLIAAEPMEAVSDHSEAPSRVRFDEVRIIGPPEDLRVEGLGGAFLAFSPNPPDAIRFGLHGEAPSRTTLRLVFSTRGTSARVMQFEVVSPLFEGVRFATPGGGVDRHAWSDPWEPIALPRRHGYLDFRLMYDLAHPAANLPVTITLDFVVAEKRYRVHIQATILFRGEA